MRRNISLDILKLLMAFTIVCIHTNVFECSSPILQYVFENGLFRISVPAFLLVNGFYFYQYDKDGKSYEWFRRVVILYVVWMLIYSPFSFYWPPLSIRGMVDFLIFVLVGHHHLWYISGMIGGAAIVSVAKRFSWQAFSLLILFMFATGVVLQYAGSYHVFDSKRLDWLLGLHWIHRNFAFLSFPFFGVGYLINRHSIAQRISSLTVGWLAFAGGGLLVVEALLNFVFSSRDAGFDNLASLLIICPAIFLLFEKKTWSGSSKWIALYSTAIYLIHPMIQCGIIGLYGLKCIPLCLLTILFSIIASTLLIVVHRRTGYIL